MAHVQLGVLVVYVSASAEAHLKADVRTDVQAKAASLPYPNSASLSQHIQ